MNNKSATTYYSTFITGFESVIKQVLPQSLDNAQIIEVVDGVVFYKTTSSIEKIKNLKYLNNSFILLLKVERLGKNPMSDMMKLFIHNNELQDKIKGLTPGKKSFRVRPSVENQIVSVDRNLLNKVEGKISQLTGSRVDRSLPDIEFWISVRREGYGLIGIRFTRRSNYEKTLERGELYPELANILCLISDPTSTDVFLDPFCGSGAIPIQRAITVPSHKIIASDSDQQQLNKLVKKIGKLRDKIMVKKWNALKINELGNSSVNRIVTDPPWGLHSGKNLNLQEFYSNMLREFIRIISRGGIIVILTAQKDILESELKKLSNFLVLVTTYSTLVSGKKAGVYKLKRL